MIRRLPVRAMVAIGLLLILTSQGLSAAPSYRREDWKHWLKSTTADPCRLVRDEVLVRDGQYIAFVDEMPQEGKVALCRVISGLWKDAYSGAMIRGKATLMDVDHLVPLKWAHDHGAAGWPKERKAEYANNLDYRRHLIPTARALNRQKGAKGPDAWVPPDRAAHCQYGESWATVIVIHGLTPTPAVRAAIRDLVKTCGPFGRDR